MNEEENIGTLISSIVRQDYRPIEIMVVDDGSRDKTTEIVEALRQNLSSPTLSIRLLFTGGRRGTSTAFNIGIKNSLGSYLLILPADTVMIDVSFLTRLRHELDLHPIVRFRIKVIVDTWLELNQLYDDFQLGLAEKRYGWCSRREILENILFDERLGVGEDMDIETRIEQRFGRLFDRAPIAEAELGMHHVHTLREFYLQRRWRGKTYWLHALREKARFLNVVVSLGPFLLLALGVILLAASSPLWAIPIAVLVGYSTILLVKSKKSFSRFCYILFIRLLFGSISYFIGFVIGLWSYYLTHDFSPSRDE